MEHASHTPSKRDKAGFNYDYFIGIILLLVVVFLWTSASFIMSSMFKEQAYNKPFFVTWLCTSSFAFYLIPAGIRYWWNRHEDNKSREGYVPLSPSNTTSNLPTSPPFSTHSAEDPLTVKETAHLALIFCGLWFIANFLLNTALGFTSVSSTTILSSMSGFFTLMLGAAFGGETFTNIKLVSVFASVFGVALVSKADHDVAVPLASSSVSALFGDVLALASAACYAFYVLLLKVRTKDESRISMITFFGFVGMWNILLLWPVIVLLHWTGFEPFELPHGKKLIASVVVNSLITFVSDMLMMIAMLKTSPLAVTLGLSLTIPLAVIGDLFKGTKLGGLYTLFGAILVVGAFVAVGVADGKVVKDEETDDLLNPARSRSRSNSRVS